MAWTRRDFLAGALAVGASQFFPEAPGAEKFSRSERPKITSGTDRVPLGRTGLKPTVLGIGTGTRGGSEQLALGQEGFVRLFRHAYERGIRYIDTADMYSTHLFVRFAIQGLPREELFILTKTRAIHPEVAKADIDRFRRELRTDYLDCVLMHCMTKRSFPRDMRPVMDVLSQAKEKGRIRAIGISSHGMDPLLASVDCDWIEVQLVRINPFGKNMDGRPDQVLPICKKIHDTGRGLLGMKIYGETGYQSREQRLQALRYVLRSGAVDAFTIGFSKPEQIDETLELIREALSS